jgi:tRNA A-37 threonylcarbamoyl transferase component Bud32
LSGSPVVVKQFVDGPEAADRYAREVTALQLASTVDPPVVPRLLGTDPTGRVLVLEHLEHEKPRPDWIVDYATALARLHSATGAGLPAWSGPGQHDIDSFLGLARTLGAAVPAGARDELEGLVDRLSRMEGTALLHGDPCPGNDLHTSAGVRFIDFEQAAQGNGLVELAYLRIGFPTCWCATIPHSETLAAAEAAYRATWQNATGTEVSGDLTDACAGWLLRGDALVQRAERQTTDHLARIPNHDWKWGTATARQRLAHRLQIVGRMVTEGSQLPNLGRLTAGLGDIMHARWPALQPLPFQRP